jgi:hypothetical protein
LTIRLISYTYLKYEDIDGFSMERRVTPYTAFHL